MINVPDVLANVEKMDGFPSVERLYELVEALAADSRFSVVVAGTSANGRPIHHVRCGSGTVKALLVAYPHCMEPIGGLTVFSLLSLLQRQVPSLISANVEWNIVPCIDPDGALLNEGWTQDFTFDRYLKNYFMQSPRDQADMSFPISYKRLVVDAPSPEVMILKSVIDQVKPDFYFTLHNTRVGGASFYLSQDIDHKYHGQLYELLDTLKFPIEKRPPWKEVSKHFGEGIVEVVFTKNVYDFLEKTIPEPEKYELIRYGANSWDYVRETNPNVLTFLAEMGCVRHSYESSEKPVSLNLRSFKLLIDAGSKYLATVLLDEWSRLKPLLDPTSPFFRAIEGGCILPRRESVVTGGWPMSRYPTSDILFNPNYERQMTEADLLDVCMVDSGFYFIQWSYGFLRLLESSPKSNDITRAIGRITAAFDLTQAEIGRHLDINEFRPNDCSVMAKVQLGSGLIVLNSLL